jgi:hypothetical protein
MTPDRVLLVDPADVGVAERIVRCLALESSVQVRPWLTPQNGAVVYLRADTLRDLEGA